MACGIEWIVLDGILRGGPEYEKFGDPFSYAAAIIIQENKLCIKGLAGEI